MTRFNDNIHLRLSARSHVKYVIRIPIHVNKAAQVPCEYFHLLLLGFTRCKQALFDAVGRVSPIILRLTCLIASIA